MAKSPETKTTDLKRLYPSIGEFMIQYAKVQGVLRTVLLKLLRVRSKAATSILMHGMSDSVATRKVKQALRAHGRNFVAFQAAIKDLEKVTAFRDKLVHWEPMLNSSRTTLQGLADSYKDYQGPNQPQLNITPAQVKKITRWLRTMEWDMLTVILTIDDKVRFDPGNFRTLQQEKLPSLPQASYEKK